jgi:uncharacterized protein involved in exopolysaccharide biosynthesis
MTKAIEILFRHKARLLVLLLLPTLIGAAIVLVLPRQYQANAGLWALRRYEILGATGPESDLTSTPAETQVTALQELLQTRSFVLAVAYDTDLPKQVGGANVNTQNVQDALYTDLSTHVVVTAAGYNLFEVTYTNTDAVVAMQVVRAVIAHYATQSTSQATAEGQQLLASYQAQLAAAQHLADSATQAATQYLRDHGLTLAAAQVDPQYQLLAAQADQARTALADVQNNINTINQEMAVLSAGAAGLYNTIDAPKVPNRAESRTKTLLLGGGIGLAVGLLASISYFLLLMRLDQSLYSLADVAQITSHPVLVQIPQLPRRSVAWTPQAHGKLQLDKG